MKYPNHILIDVQTRQVLNWFTLWEPSYLSKSTFLLRPSAVVYAYTSKLITSIYQVPHTTFTQHHFKPVLTPTSTKVSTTNLLTTLFTIQFLRKERLYTKLKYSRCPQYDIVSGGIAAILAGLIGFLISEKFGIELVDSGDWYILVMYLIIVNLAVRPIIRTLNDSTTIVELLSFEWLYQYLKTTITLFGKLLMNRFRTIIV